MLQRCQGARISSHHHIFLLQQLPACAHFLSRVDWQSHSVCAAWSAVRAFHALQMWTGTPWSEKQLITLQSLIFEALLSTWCLSRFHCSVGCQPLLWRYFKIVSPVSPVSDLLTLSRYHPDCFLFSLQGWRTKECQESLQLINPFCSLLKCVCKLFLWPASCSVGILVLRLLHFLPGQMRQILKPVTCPNSLPG